MLRPKPIKTEPRQFKNILISSRNQQQGAYQQTNDQKHSNTTNFLEKSRTEQNQQSINRIQWKSTNNSNIQSNQSCHKKLKLKDYIHLNSIEKRNKSKTSINNSDPSSMVEQKRKVQTIQRQEKKKVNILQNSQKKQVPANRTSQNDSSMMIKSEIAAKIQEQRKKLSDLQAYLEKDFQSKQDMAETFVFLFEVYNKMIDIHKMNEQIGENITNYEKKQSIQLFKTPQIIKKASSYHWEDQKKELNSPAKIMKNAYKLTFDITQMLNFSK